MLLGKPIYLHPSVLSDSVDLALNVGPSEQVHLDFFSIVNLEQFIFLLFPR